MPITVLVLTGLAVSLAVGRADLSMSAHGFSEILYGSPRKETTMARHGRLTGNTSFYNIIGAIDMLIGRFGIMIPALALGGVLAAKDVVPESLGTFRTDNGCSSVSRSV